MGLIQGAAEAPENLPAASVDELDSADPEIRRRAALDLAAQPDAVPALLDHISGEPDPRVRDALLTTLAAHDNAAVARALIRHLASDDPGLRTAVVDALATMTGAVPPLLPQLTTSPDPDVRILTAMLLATLPDPSALSSLVDMISADPHPNVVAAAIDALLPMATATHIPLLEGTLVRFPEDPFLRFTISTAVPRLVGVTT
jgi:HEAT repeat protein